MGKSSRKSTVEVVPAAVSVPPSKSTKKGKRNAEVASEKSASAKKPKKEIVEVQIKQKGNKKSKKVPPPKKKIETGTSEDTSSDSEEVVIIPPKNVGKPVKQPIKKPTSSDEDSDSPSEEEQGYVQKAVTGKKALPEQKNGVNPDSSSETSESDSDDEEVTEKTSSVIKSATKATDEAPKVSAATKKVPVSIKAALTTTHKKKDVSSDTSESDEDEEKMHVANQSAASGSKTLFVGNLSYDVVVDDVFEFFGEAGEVADVRLAKTEDGEFRGFGHVEFSSAEAAQKALNDLNGQELSGRAIKLDFARERERAERGSYTPNSGSYQKGQKGQSHTIFIKGFDTSLEMNQIESSIQEFFNSCGEVTRISLPRDFETGTYKGIGYLDFKDSDSFSKALELSGSELGGYTITVEEAKPKNDNRDGGGFSGGRGGRGGGWNGGRSGGRGRDGGHGGGRRGGRDGGGRRGRGGDRGRGGRGSGGRFGSGTGSHGKKTRFGDD